MNAIGKIPVTIISGFLGSGKTSFLNHIIGQNPHKKIAIIENEFGSINIDSTLVVGVKGNIYELSNGCICCTLNNDLIAVLESILAHETKIDHLVIEATGIADTGALVAPFLSYQNIVERFQIDAIITIVDAYNFENQIQQHAQVEKQVAIADCIIINKVSSITAFDKKNLIKKLSAINSLAKLYECNYGVVNKADMLNLHLFENSNTHIASQQLAQAKKRDYQLAQTFTHSFTASLSFRFSEPLDFDRFSTWVKLLISTSSESIFRIKGILYFENNCNQVVYQSVYNQSTFNDANQWQVGEQRESRVVFIGKNLDKRLVGHGLEICKSQMQKSTDEDLYRSVIAIQDSINQC